MTVIAAARTNRGVTIAADAQSSIGWQKGFHESPKLWVAGSYAVGAAGDLRTAQVIQHYTTWPKWRPDEDETWEKHLVRSVVPAIKTALTGAGVIENDKGIESWHAQLIVACGKDLGVIYGNGCVFVHGNGRAAIGSGGAEALGHLGNVGPWTPSDVREAARKATLTDMGCSGPVSTVDTERLTVKTR